MGIPSVLSYLDYRHFLDDVYVAMKQGDAKMSQRRFARLAGSTSPNFLQLIRARKLNVHSDAIGALSRALKLTKKQVAYFETIVAFDHAKTHDEKDRLFRRILSSRDYGPVKRIGRNQYEYFSHWYVPVVRELLISPDYPDDPQWIATRIIPAVTVPKVKRAVRLLEALGMVHREADGRWRQTDTAISTPAEVMSVAVTRYHRDVIAMASDSIERFAASRRDIRSVTIGLSEGGARELKKRLEAFWKELLAFSATQTEPRKVVQVNVQMFPMSKDSEEQRP